MTTRIARNLAEVSTTALDLVTGRYPSFVYGAEIRPGQIPVFCFHGAEPDLFERRLAFLAENGYETLTADEYIAVMLGDAAPPPKAVMLTFDDGWASLWSIGFPVLKKYGLKIVVFLIPGRITNRAEYLPNLTDQQEGRCSPEQVSGRDSSENPLLTWEEITEMHESGLVDFQSHSYSHTLVCRSARVVDFVNPAMLRTCNLLELPWPAPTRLGEPLYESASRLSDERRFFPPERISEECTSIVRQLGPRFFERPDWRGQLRDIVRRYGPGPNDAVSETGAEHSAAVWLEMLNSKRLIEEHLPGKEVRHICYPWHVAGETALRIAAEVGYRAGYLGKVDGGYNSRGTLDPLRTPRIGADYFFRLPGNGRVSLAETVRAKFLRRIRQGSPYLAH